MNSKNTSITKFSGTTSRRKFISTCAACGACMVIAPLASMAMTSEASLNSSGSSVAIKKMRIRIIYALFEVIQPKPDWPNIGFDFGPIMEHINTVLIKQFPGFEFLPTMAAGKPEAEKILSQDTKENIGGYIVYQMNCWNPVVQTIARSGKPVLYVDFQFGGSGGFLTNITNFLKTQNLNVGFVASSRITDLIAAVKCFEIVQNGGPVSDFVAATIKSRLELTPKPGDMSCKTYELQTLSTDECVRRMKESKILAARDEKSGPADPIMGIPLEYIGFAELNKAWETANKDNARAIVDHWQKTATIIDIPVETLQSSAAFYLGMKSVLKKHDANAITINCLGGFYSGAIHAYPCLGFHELNNEGLVGGCECDIRSTTTMLAFSTMTQGRPGMISDPVIDTSKRQIIYAHCVASNKVFGPDGPENPFTIMTHSEDRQGASVRSILPIDYMTTTLQINQNRKEILFHQGKAVANDPDDRACRTKLCVEPSGDIEKLFRFWDWGWHRVTFYGDLKEPVYALADAIGWKVVEEA
jgi:hypothetical protein